MIAWKSLLTAFYSSESFNLRFFWFWSITLEFDYWIVIVVVVDTVYPSLLILSSRFLMTTFELIGCKRAIIVKFYFQFLMLLFLYSKLGDHSLKSSPILLVFSDNAINSSNFSFTAPLLLPWFWQFDLVSLALQHSHSSYNSWSDSGPYF